MRDATTARRARDPKEDLALRRGEVACVLADGLMTAQASDPSQTRAVVAASVGCNTTRLAALCDPEHDASIDVARASMLPASAAKLLAKYIAGDTCEVVEVGVAFDPNARPTLSLIARSQRSSSAAVSEAMEGAVDGRIDALEGARIEAAANRAIEDLLIIREVGRRAQRERVIAIAGTERVQ